MQIQFLRSEPPSSLLFLPLPNHSQFALFSSPTMLSRLRIPLLQTAFRSMHLSSSSSSTPLPVFVRLGRQCIGDANSAFHSFSSATSSSTEGSSFFLRLQQRALSSEVATGGEGGHGGGGRYGEEGGKGRGKLFKLIALGLGIGTVLYVAGSCLAVVPVGHVAIVDLFGSVVGKPLASGISFVPPLSTVHMLSVKTRVMELQLQVPSKEGLVVDFEMAILFHLDATMAKQVYSTIGLNYTEVVLAPQLRSAVRHLTSAYDVKALYTSESREAMSAKLVVELRELLGPRGIIIEDALLKEVRLPATLQAAIQAKLASEQESQRMEFVLVKEKAEAERKAIEAKGISDFQKIVSEGVSPALLQWKGIEATEALAMSPNTKVVVIGNSSNGLPIILGGDTIATENKQIQSAW